MRLCGPPARLRAAQNQVPLGVTSWYSPRIHPAGHRLARRGGLIFLTVADGLRLTNQSGGFALGVLVRSSVGHCSDVGRSGQYLSEMLSTANSLTDLIKAGVEALGAAGYASAVTNSPSDASSALPEALSRVHPASVGNAGAEVDREAQTLDDVLTGRLAQMQGTPSRIISKGEDVCFHGIDGLAIAEIRQPVFHF